MRHVIIATVATLAGDPAFAGLEICNDTDRSLSIAIGYSEQDKWVSEGWWNLGPGDCKTPVSGDLKNRYYYYRATADGAPFATGKAMFCSTKHAFTIRGDTECESRGYDRVGFRKLDTGKRAKHFTLTLVDNSEPEPAPVPAPTTAAPGTYGEPYSNAANLQGCTVNGPRECSFHADGTQFFVRDDGRTPQYVFSILSALDPGTPIAVEGDLEAIYDRTADIVLRDATVRPWTRFDTLLYDLQGSWYSVDDPNSQFTVLGSERDNSYDSEPMGRDYLTIGPWCGDFQSGGPYLSAREEETGETLCYEILKLADFQLDLMYLPRGNILSYRQLD